MGHKNVMIPEWTKADATFPDGCNAFDNPYPKTHG